MVNVASGTEMIPESSEAERLFAQFIGEMMEIADDAIRINDDRRARINENRAFNRGDQHGAIDRSGKWVSRVPTDPHVKFETMPVIGGSTRLAVERRMSAWPEINIRAPSRGFVADMQAKIMEGMFSDFRITRPDFYFNLLTSDIAAEVDGASFLHTYWNPRIGPKVANYVPGDWPTAGDWMVEAESILDLIVDPTARSWYDVRYVIHRKALARTDAEQMLPKDIFGRSTAGRFQKWGARRRHSIDYDDRRADPLASSQEKNETVEILDIYWKPSVDWPDGLLISISDMMCLAYPNDKDPTGSPQPTLPDKFFPWTINFGSNLVHFSIFPDGNVAQLIGPQRSLNYIHGLMKASAGWGAAPAIIAPYQSEIPKGAFTNVAGKVVRYRYPFKPDILKGEGVGTDQLQYASTIRESINDISGYTDEARGLVDSANATAARIQTNANLNTQLHGSTLALRGYAIAEVAKNIFSLIARRYDEGRLMYTRGRSNRVEVMAFYEGVVNPDCMFTFDPSNIVRNDQATVMQQAREDFNNGIYDDTPAAIRFRKIHNIATEADGEVLDERQIDYRNARERCVMFFLAVRRGEQPPPECLMSPADEHAIHLEVYRLAMLDPEFRLLPPEAQDWFIQNMVIPQQEIADEKAQEAAMTGAVPPDGLPAEGAPGHASPPAPQGAPGRPPEPGENLPPAS